MINKRIPIIELVVLKIIDVDVKADLIVIMSAINPMSTIAHEIIIFFIIVRLPNCSPVSKL
jgi:hypothetical protein